MAMAYQVCSIRVHQSSRQEAGGQAHALVQCTRLVHVYYYSASIYIYIYMFMTNRQRAMRMRNSVIHHVPCARISLVSRRPACMHAAHIIHDVY